MFIQKNKKIAIIHDWLTGMRGGEKVLELLIDLFPGADIFTLVWVKGSVSERIEKQKITASFLQNYPFIKTGYRHLLPLFPLAAESFDLRGYDLVISSSHCAAKGVIPAPGAKHVCYCYSPMRYIWNMYPEYFGKNRNALVDPIYRTAAHYLRMWDLSTNDRVDDFMAISNAVAARINRYYRRDSTVIYPPVNTAFYRWVPERPVAAPYHLVVSALVPYKRIDLAVDAFNENGKKLVIIGEGPEKRRLARTAKPNITFLGWVGNDMLRQYYSHCQALVFPGEEDFGIVPLEAQACGSPVIAYARGGALETIIDGETGLFFREQLPASLNEAITRAAMTGFDRQVIVTNAQRFSEGVFCDKIQSHVRSII
jgi:glycosyltransferase involved in cell wall biosynthesis